MNLKDNLPFTFIGDTSGFDEADVVFLLCPYEGAVSYEEGTKEGPDLIIRASEQIESYDPELQFDLKEKIKMHTMQSLKLNEFKDEELIDRIYQATKIVYKKDKFPVMLGGDHSISIGAIEAAAEKHKDLTVLQIDAHADLRDSFNKDRFSHACVMRRALDFRVNLVQVGIRSLSKEEHDFIKKNDIKTYFAPFRKETIPTILSDCTKNVYVTIDADGFDPSLIPATGTPVPGGLLWYEALDLFRELFHQKNIVGMDFVELKDSDSTRSQDTAAILIYKLLGYRFQ